MAFVSECGLRAVPDMLVLSKLRVAAATETLIPPGSLQAAIVAAVPNSAGHSEKMYPSLTIGPPR